MSTIASHQILAQILDPVGECWTPAVASRIASLRANPQTQRRLDALAEKNAEGRLTRREEDEYDAYIEALDVIAILQAKARKLLRHSGRAK
jgi:hypothetical protein